MVCEIILKILVLSIARILYFIYEIIAIVLHIHNSVYTAVCIPYTQKFSWYEIFAEQEANGIFAIIFLRITGSSWKGSMLCTVTNL